MRPTPTRPNPVLPAGRPADVEAARRRQHQARLEHNARVIHYARQHGVDVDQAHAFYASQMKAERVLQYIRAHPGLPVEVAEWHIDQEDRAARRGR